MAVSGTIALTSFDTTKVIEIAFRRCKLPPQRISGELMQLARDSLYLLLSELGSYTQKLWAAETLDIALDQGRAMHEMPDGTIDVTNANLRLTTPVSGTVGERLTGVTVMFDAPQRIPVIGFTVVAEGTYDLVFEATYNGTDWVKVGEAETEAYIGAENYWADIDGAPTCLGICVRDAYSRDLAGWQIRPIGAMREIPIQKISKDAYFQIPNKDARGRPNQFWVERQRDTTICHLWPVPDDDTAANAQLIIRRNRHLMDVGDLTGNLDVPQSWLNVIIAMLAYQLALDAVEVDAALAPGLKAVADEKLAIALSAETDDSTITVNPGIAAYTR